MASSLSMALRGSSTPASVSLSPLSTQWASRSRLWFPSPSQPSRGIVQGRYEVYLSKSAGQLSPNQQRAILRRMFSSSPLPLSQSKGEEVEGEKNKEEENPLATRSTEATAGAGGVVASEGKGDGEGTPEVDPTAKHHKKIAIWLFMVAGVVFVMVIVGGLTRLTESGLSMTTWKPVTGVIPPLTEEQWEEEFAKYRLSPEFELKNSYMTVEDFKKIYRYEWSHRVLGRFIGAVFLGPFLYFAGRGYLNRSMKTKFAILFGMGGLQGVVGWWMVKSGLKKESLVDADHPRVSPYRLAFHLGSAFVIYLVLLQTAVSLTLPVSQLAAAKALPKMMRHGAHAITQLTFWTAMSGAFVAGNRAGMVYPEFPFMGEGLKPVDYIDDELEPRYKNYFENPANVQFNHRVLATTTFTTTWAYYLWARKLPLIPQTRLALNSLLLMANLQVALGISTLLNSVPTHLAATHQGGSLTLLSIAVWLMMQVKRIPIR
eukprot:TRINITY_DN1548_c0_g1_i2.p1 TRINITY_DN1548_c0_g1~~TRINITY_DN1548_c0_g1_i2.p1  ORF type:complete len:487 (+),score=122.97 TRINITY_DN1548_c0_g1_i2:90-1550(+)